MFLLRVPDLLHAIRSPFSDFSMVVWQSLSLWDCARRLEVILLYGDLETFFTLCTFSGKGNVDSFRVDPEDGPEASATEVYGQLQAFW